jgi:anaerobic magnesium-protoporphyrin IX monomethyl ester cyclase
VKIYLLFPPHWTPAMPHLALPVLTGWLRRHGYQVTQRDLNVETYDEILTRRHLRRAVEQIKQRFGQGASSRPLPFGRPQPDQVQWALQNGPQLAEKIEAAKAVLRSPDFYQVESAEPSFLTVVAALELDSLAHYPAQLELTRFIGPGRPDSSRDLLRAARDPQINPFYDIFRNGVLRDLERERPELVGISIPTEGQFLAGLTLAALIRDAGLKCHITVGGPHITMLREQLPKVPAVFDLIDSAVLFDGEQPLLSLVRALEGDGDLSGVPNLVYRAAGVRSEIRTNPPVELVDIRAAQHEQTPDFEGLALERYLAPEPILPLMTAHGCYHGKCGFCNVGYGNPFHYSPIELERLVGQMVNLREKYNCRHFFFVDEAITPRTLRLMPDALEKAGGEFNWASAARLEKALTDPILAELPRGGCRMLLFGLESASEPIMKFMDKGTLLPEMARVLESGAAAGIWNHTFFFFGFPGESMADAQATVNFIYEHQAAIHSGSPGAFLLERYSPVYNDPAKYGVRQVETHPSRDLAIYFEFELERGLDEVMANRLADGFVEQLTEKRNGMYYVSDVYRFLFASELHRRGQPLPRWIE